MQVDVTKGTGDTAQPWGVPLSVSSYIRSSRYPALSMLRISRRNRLIVDLSQTGSRERSRRLIDRVSKQPEMSPSTNHVVPPHERWTSPQRGMAASPGAECVRAV